MRAEVRAVDTGRGQFPGLGRRRRIVGTCGTAPYREYEGHGGLLLVRGRRRRRRLVEPAETVQDRGDTLGVRQHHADEDDRRDTAEKLEDSGTVHGAPLRFVTNYRRRRR